MKLVQILTLVYIGLGIVAGFVSNTLENRGVAVMTALLIYMISYTVLTRVAANKKKGWLVINSLVTFILVWLVVWIFLFNIR